MRLMLEARCRGGTALSPAAGSPLAAARCDPRRHGAILGAAVRPGGQMQCAEHQVLGTVPTGTAAATVLALSVSMPVAEPWHAGQWLPTWQLISCN